MTAMPHFSVPLRMFTVSDVMQDALRCRLNGIFRESGYSLSVRAADGGALQTVGKRQKY